MSDRVKDAFGYGPNEKIYGKSWAENIAYRFYSANHANLNLIIDDNVPNRGHRINLLNPDWTHVGIGNGPHAGYDWMQVQNFAYGFEVTNKVCPYNGNGGWVRPVQPVKPDEEDEVEEEKEEEKEEEVEPVEEEEEEEEIEEPVEEEVEPVEEEEQPSTTTLGPEHGPSKSPVPIIGSPPEEWPEDAYYRYKNTGAACESADDCTITRTYTYYFRPEDSGLKMIYEEKTNHTLDEVIAMFSFI